MEEPGPKMDGGVPGGQPDLPGAPFNSTTVLQPSPEPQIGSDEANKGANKRGVAQAGKPRAIKTPLQKEALEAAFQINQFPSEEKRRDLGARIELTEQQVQVWFSHRRRREKKAEHQSPAGDIRQGLATPDRATSPNISHSAGQQPGIVTPTLSDNDAHGSRLAACISDAEQVAGSRQHHSDGQVGQAAAQISQQLPPASNGPLGDNQISSSYTRATPPSSGGQQQLSRTGSGSVQPNLPAQSSGAPKVTAKPQQPHPAPAPVPECATQSNDTSAAPQAHPPHSPERLRQPDESPSLGGVSDRVATGLHESPAAFAPQPTSGSRPPPSSQYPDDACASDESDDEAVPSSELHELLELAKAQMEVPFQEQGPVMSYFFDRSPEPGPPEDGTATGEATLKRKLVQLGDYEMEAANGNFHATKRRNLNTQRQARPSMKAQEGDKEEKREKRRVEAAEREARKAEAQRVKEADRVRTAMQREARRQEAAAEKEKRAEERKRQAEDRRKEKEMLKALAAQEKEVLRMRQREAQSGPRDDLDLEWQSLLDAQRSSSEYQDVPEEEIPPPVRPPFPPPSLTLQPAFPASFEPHASEVLQLWGFLHSFGDILGLVPLTLEALAAAVLGSASGKVLGELHMALLRVLQADIEESHASGALQTGGAANFVDQAVKQSAQVLEEAWAWGLDVDAWRAHLNPLTWPEVMRQWAIAAGHGRRRPKPKREVRPKLGTEGEDTTTDAQGNLLLRLPPRFGPHTVKGAAWQVLSDQGPNGLNIAEIARRIQRSGLRDLSTSKTPEASVVAALSRDVIFARVAPGTYALQAVVSHHQRSPAVREATPQEGEGKHQPSSTPRPSPAPVDTKPTHAAESVTKLPARSEEPASQDPTTEAAPEDGLSREAPRHDGAVDRQVASIQPSAETQASRPQVPAPVEPLPKAEEELHDDSEDEEEEEEEEEPAEAAHEGEAWVRDLEAQEYSQLGLDTRLAILATLVAAVLDSPSLRACLEMRLEENQRIRRQMFEEARVEKKQRQAEQAAKARAAAEEAQRAYVDKYGAPPPGMAPLPPPTPPATPAAESKGEQNNAEEDEILSATVQRQRQQQRAETVRRAEELNAARGEPLGLDRRHNKYWRFWLEDHPEGDAGAGRLYIESAADGGFRVLTHQDDLQELLDALERRGAREERLFAELLRQQDSLTRGMPSQPFRLPGAPGSSASREEADQLHRIHLHAGYHLKQDPGPSPQSNQQDGPAVSKLKGDMHRVQAALPREALEAGWDDGAWRAQVAYAGSIAELRLLLGRLEEAILDGWLSPHFQRSPLLVKGAWLPTGKEVASALLGTNGEVQQLPSRRASTEPPAQSASHSHSQQPHSQATPPRATSPARSISPQPGPSPLAWLPATAAALALRLYALDASLIYGAGRPPARDSLQGYSYVQRPALAMAAVAVAGANGQELQHAGCVAKQRHRQGDGSHTIPGLPVGLGGRMRSTIFPSFPQVALQGSPKPFTFPVEEFSSAVGAAMASGTILTAAAPPPQPPPQLRPGHQAPAPALLPAPGRGGGARGKGAGGRGAHRRQPSRGADSDWGEPEPMDIDGRSFSRASTGAGASEDEGDYEDSKLGVHGSDDDLDDAVPAFDEGDVDISD